MEWADANGVAHDAVAAYAFYNLAADSANALPDNRLYLRQNPPVDEATLGRRLAQKMMKPG